MTRLYLVIAAVLAILALFVINAALFGSAEPQVRARLVAQVQPSSGFTRAMGPRSFEFPADHGPHPDYQTEWWYYTGNLEVADGRHFGYQLTFFRSALLPASERQQRLSQWATDQVYMAHLALTDVDAGQHHAFERFSRGAAGLAGAQSSPYQVWLENWEVEGLGPSEYHLSASANGIEIDLQLLDKKGSVLQGEAGFSQKGSEPGNASYYYSLTRMATGGTIRVDDRAYAVEGLSWMDHEYSTSALGADLVGWDWFSVQLDDGSELMVYQLRRADGSADPFSNGSFIDANGQKSQLGPVGFNLAVASFWTSPHSGATYPSGWTLEVPSADLTLELMPYLADQELDLNFVYWEGAVRVSGQRAGRAVGGNGYVELTGYAETMQGRF
jgi:predicted secreted hydrolase